MEGNPNSFVQLENAKVLITGIRCLKEYLGKVITTYNGYPVCKFTTAGDEVFVHVFNHTRGKLQKHFFGYVDDVAMNVQNGFYEPKEDE